MRARSLRGLPLAALVCVSAALVAMKLSSRHTTSPNDGLPAFSSANATDLIFSQWAPAGSTAAFAPFGDASAISADASATLAITKDGGDGGTPDFVARTMHGDASRSHRAHGHGPKSVHIAWTVNVGGAVAAQVTASPDGASLYVATLSGSLVALSLSGEKKWTYALHDRAYGAPAISSDGTILVGSDAKKMIALHPNGELAFSLEVDGEADSSPLPMNDGGWVFAAGNKVIRVLSRGDVEWTFAAKKKVYSAPTLAGNRIVFGSQDHRLIALTLTGEIAYAIDLGADVDCAPASVGDGSVVVGTDGGEVVRVDALGNIVWRTQVRGYVRGGVTITRAGEIVVGTFGPVPRVVRLFSNGAIRDAFEIQGTGARDFGIWGSPLEDDDGSLYFGAEDDTLYATDARGALLFSYKTRADIDAPVTMLADGSLIVASEDSTVSRLVP